MTTSLHKLYEIQDLLTHKSWILDLIRIPDADTNAEETDNDTKFELVLCDLESRWGNRSAPELDKTLESDAGWTEKSDIYDIAACIRGMMYANSPINPTVGAEWEVPAPLDMLCQACTVPDPMMRPTLDELEALVVAIEAA